MVNVKLDKPTKRNRMPDPPEQPRDTGNLHKPAAGDKVPLQLKISPELRREVKAYAAERDLAVSDLFQTVWEHYRNSNG